jgi:hypothetical protein
VSAAARTRTHTNRVGAIFTTVYTFAVAFLTQHEHMGSFNDETRAYRGRLVHCEMLVSRLTRFILEYTCLPVAGRGVNMSSGQRTAFAQAQHSTSIQEYSSFITDAMTMPV